MLIFYLQTETADNCLLGFMLLFQFADAQRLVLHCPFMLRIDDLKR
jgi:hypothetical protein